MALAIFRHRIHTIKKIWANKKLNFQGTLLSYIAVLIEAAIRKLLSLSAKGIVKSQKSEKIKY